MPESSVWVAKCLKDNVVVLGDDGLVLLNTVVQLTPMRCAGWESGVIH